MHFCVFFTRFLGKDSAEASAEASVKVAEASVLAESHFRPIRSFTTFCTSFIEIRQKKENFY